MKKTNLITIAIFAIVSTIAFSITSCDKASDREQLSQTGDVSGIHEREGRGHSLRMQMVALSPAAQRYFFDAQTDEDKFLIWQDKMDQVLALTDFTPSERSLLEELNAKLCPALYNTTSSEAQAFDNSFEANWKARATAVFEYDKLGTIVCTIEDYVGIAKPTASSGDCECSLTSDWCFGSMVCNTNRCDVSAHGCGTLWTHKCNGMCGW